jgi:hypothetical protein
MAPARSDLKTTADEQAYQHLLAEIDSLLAGARQKVNAALLMSIDDPSQLQAMTRLDNLLADPTQYSHDLLRSRH